MCLSITPFKAGHIFIFFKFLFPVFPLPNLAITMYACTGTAPCWVAAGGCRLLILRAEMRRLDTVDHLLQLLLPRLPVCPPRGLCHDLCNPRPLKSSSLREGSDCSVLPRPAQALKYVLLVCSLFKHMQQDGSHHLFWPDASRKGVLEMMWISPSLWLMTFPPLCQHPCLKRCAGVRSGTQSIDR